MVTLCWAAKGGSGTTVTATILAMVDRSSTLLVDLDGEVPRVLGLPAPDRPGLADWLGSDAPEAHLDDLLIDVDDNLRVLPWTNGRATSLDPLREPVAGFSAADADRRRRCLSWLTSRTGERVIVDAGTGEPSADLVDVAETSLLVTRPCYLSVQRALRLEARPTGIALIDEKGRGLSGREIERSVGAPIVATLSYDPAVGRAVDAGLLTHKLPGGICRTLRRVD